MHVLFKLEFEVPRPTGRRSRSSRGSDVGQEQLLPAKRGASESQPRELRRPGMGTDTGTAGAEHSSSEPENLKVESNL
jgi:hypothetical protein